MTKDFDDEAFARDLRMKLRASENNHDSRTRTRLSAARSAALDESTRSGFGGGIPVWGTVAAVAMLAVLVSQTWTTDIDAEPELIESLEMLEVYEDLEFYEWLAETELQEMHS